MAALVNGVTLVVVAIVIVVAALDRLSDPPEVEGAGVLALGFAGLAGNVAATWVLARGERSDINLEAVLRHSFADALGSVGVVAAGAVVLATGWHEADPIAGLMIAALILASSVRVIREPLDILMEAAPAGLDPDSLAEEICAMDGVRSVHELHVWTVTSGFDALAAHVVVDPGAERDEVRRRLEAMLGERYELEHTTLQMEEQATDELLQIEPPGNRN
jgi:cobalt-zinc-cadmium efflux system protein